MFFLCSILEIIPFVLENNVHSTAVSWNVLCLLSYFEARFTPSACFWQLNCFALYFFNFSHFIEKAKKHRDREWFFFSFDGSLLKCPEHTGLDQTKPECPELSVGFPYGFRDSGSWDITCCFPAHTAAGGWIGNGVARSWVKHYDMGFRHLKQWA